jgi:alginate O-acetyltransferase complex protein AlgI
MLFNSFPYLLLFLPATAAIYGLVRTRAGWPWSQAWLLIASLLFYAYAKPSNLILLLSSIVFNWAIVRVMMAQTAENRRKLFLWIGLSVNITVLFLFKYINFFLGTLAFFHGPHLELPDWGFPLGVSFFTLTQIMYLVDAFPRVPNSPAARKIFQGLKGPNSLFDHATFVALFPYVTSGPLVRAGALVPQLRESALPERPLDLAGRGLFLFSLGLAKKVVLADSFATIADAGFGSIRDLSMLEAWIFSFASLLQIYFDFSGYSDMALGSAWMVGIDIPQNFNAPLRSKSISEFWQRWHISLSNFITNYLYKPILRSMSKPTLAASAAATVLAMTIAGLWHGPAWTFVTWGFLHGIALAANQVWKQRKLRMPDWLGGLVTVLFVASSIVFFRSPDMPFALHMLSRLAPHANVFGLTALNGLLPASPMILLRPVTIGVMAAFFFKSSMELSKTFLPTFRTALATTVLVLTALFFMNSVPARPFIYFAF